MEQPAGSLDELQPQDLSTSSIAAVIDLTGNGEDCLLNATSLDALRMVTSPGWFPNSGASNPGLPFSEAGSSNITLQSGDRVQPDRAFSHATVTLSYVSRSCVFATHDSRCGVPSISSLSLRPPCDFGERLGDTGYSLKQHYLQPAEAPVGLATPVGLFQSLSQAQVGPEKDDAGCLRQGSQEINGEGEGDAVQEEHVLSEDNRRFLENGRGNSRASSGVCAEASQEHLTPVAEEETGGSGVLLIGARDLCSLNPEYISPLEDPVSPSVTSQDDVEDVFVLPQASSSPSGDNSYLETTDGAAWNGSSTEEAMRSDSSNGSEQSAKRGRGMLEHLIDLTHDACLSGVMGSQPETAVPHVSGNATAPQRSLKEGKVSARCGSGMRLDAVVMNINSSRYVSGCARTGKRAGGSRSTAGNSKLTSAKKNGALPEGGRTNGVKEMKGGESNSPTSNSGTNHSTTAHRTSSPKSSPLLVHKSSKEKPEQRSQPDPSVDVHLGRLSPQSNTPKKSLGTGSKPSPTSKSKAARTKSRRRHRKGQVVPLVSPREPEIRLKYVHYKEAKRDWSLESFSPFIHVERQQSPSLCAVINYPEQVRAQPERGQQAPCSGFVSAVVPSTSCLQLGRASTHSQHRRPLVCCLCGLSANAMDLGDLHGPYYPEGYQPSNQTPASMPGLKDDEDYSDSESSSCSARDRGRKQVIAPTPGPQDLRPRAQLHQKGLQGRQRRSADSPVAKRARSHSGSAHVEDWYGPPVLPLESCEYWLHEDCSVWSTGVFLIKGKVYGLEEAVKVAQDTMCSSCCDPGATLGCFFKSCPNKYHYRCALESGCVLLEDNFSMKCKRHKNKSFKGPAGTRWDGR
ncbi:uncharacterized protein si:dkey-94l16.4 [Brachionichthys hirsutus]|uniref:uncharacterized protein si:dkey-94l16.4 n=1 Tax=Brachionichthys hirsutus TaxID=412623 RepID=UPI003604B34F